MREWLQVIEGIEAIYLFSCDREECCQAVLRVSISFVPVRCVIDNRYPRGCGSFLLTFVEKTYNQALMLLFTRQKTMTAR